MKFTHIITLGTAAMFFLASCEMKNELTGSLTDKADTGALELGVSVKQPVSQTRADASDIDTNTFPITVKGTSAGVDTIVRNYNTLAEMPASITVPVGTYNVSSHTPGTLEKQMTAPYYSGDTEVTVTKDITSSVNVVCRMANSRIQLNYGEDFKKAFSEWTITIDDGGEMALSYTQENLNPEAVYWYFGDNVTAIKVNITAKTTAGNTVTQSQTFRKADASENYEEVGDNFTGGDALQINMGTVESATGTVTGITIKTHITFEDESESVEIPIGPTPPTPGPGESTVTCIGKVNSDATSESNIFETGVNYSMAAGNWPTTDVLISTPAGLKSLKVTIIGGNNGFQGIATDMNFNNHEMIGSSLGDMLGSMGVSLPMPEEGMTNYTFPVGQFYAMMNLYGPTKNGQEEDGTYGEDYHEFLITVEDKDGNVVGPLSLKVTINE